MNKNRNIKPNGLKGKQVLNRMRELMGESVDNSMSKTSLVLTKKGPDGKVYGIVKENQEYYIKLVKSTKSSGLISEDFSYIGGLRNKKNESYPSYAKAIKHLNLRFLSLSESYGGPKINVFENDNLHEVEDNDGKGIKTDKETSGDNLDGDFDENPPKSSTNTGNPRKAGHDEEIIGEDVHLSEDEMMIDDMVEGLDPVGSEDGDINNDGVEDETDDYLKNKRLKIGKAIDVAENEDRLESLLSTLSESEKESLLNTLKKKV